MGDFDKANLYKVIPFFYFDPFRRFDLVIKAMAAGEAGRATPKKMHPAPILPTTEIVEAIQVEAFTATQMPKALRRSR